LDIRRLSGHGPDTKRNLEPRKRMNPQESLHILNLGVVHEESAHQGIHLLHLTSPNVIVVGDFCRRKKRYIV
jgi:hypothetical protein